MILQYKFKYLSNNNTLTRFLINIAKETNIKYKLTKNEDNINIFVQGDEDEQTNFSNNISSYLPISIFSKESSVELAEKMPDEDCDVNEKKEFNFPFCPKCLKIVEDKKSLDYYNPFVSCDLCHDYKEKTKVTKDYKKIFEDIASKIQSGLRVKINSMSGTFIYERVENLKNYENQKDINILCTNLKSLSSVVVVSSTEMVALASIEKPEIDFKVNEVYKSKNIIKTDKVSVRYASDLILYLLSKELSDLKVDFLSYTKEGDFDENFDFFESDKTKVFIPKIKYLDGDRLVLLKSENYSKNLIKTYKVFKDKSKGQFMVLLHENNLLEKTILNFYTSTQDNDNISLYSDKYDGFVDILNYKFPKSMQDLFDDINKDETGVKLLENYKNKFPQNYENALKYDINILDKKSIYSFWEIIKTILGFKQTILEGAKVCLLSKGPSIDYKFIPKDKIYNKEFDIVKLVKSGISFKLAGADDNTISLGYVESYVHFLSHIIDEISAEVEVDGMCFTGDFFTEDLAAHLMLNSYSKFYKIYYNKDFVI